MLPHGSFMMLLARMNCLSKSPIEIRDGLVFWIFKGRKGLHEDGHKRLAQSFAK